MIIPIILYAFMAVCSCAQINLYTPFRSVFRCGVFCALTVIIAGCFDIYSSMGTFSPGSFTTLMVLTVISCVTGIWACDTRLCCGIYNVVIQLCINSIVWASAGAVSRMLLPSSSAALAVRAAICVILSLTWYIVMRELRRAVWIRMPMPDHYYQGVMMIVCADYIMIAGVCVVPLRAQLFALALCVLVLIAALHAIRIPQYIIQERERTQMVIYQQQAMQAYIDSYTQYENRLRTMRHDLKHMVGTVTELIENNDYEKAGELTRQVSEWMEASGRPEYSSDPLVNAIVSDYASRFSSAGIPLEVTIRLTSDIALSDLELTTVLHNILSNTWEYCSDPNREGPVWARLKITTNRNYFFLESANTLEEIPEMVGQKILSSKKDVKELHGIGLESIQQIVSAHDGDITISTEGGQFVIRLMMLNIPSSGDGDTDVPQRDK